VNGFFSKGADSRLPSQVWITPHTAATSNRSCRRGYFSSLASASLNSAAAGRRRFFLQVYKRAGQLNQPLVKRAVGTGFVLQPQIFEHFVRLVKKLAVETIAIAKIMRVEFLSAEGLDPGGDAGALVAHRFNLNPKVQSPKSKVTHSRWGMSLPPSPCYGETSRARRFGFNKESMKP